jgi:hypothetical protein
MASKVSLEQQNAVGVCLDCAVSERRVTRAWYALIIAPPFWPPIIIAPPMTTQFQVLL